MLTSFDFLWTSRGCVLHFMVFLRFLVGPNGLLLTPWTCWLLFTRFDFEMFELLPVRLFGHVSARMFALSCFGFFSVTIC